MTDQDIKTAKAFEVHAALIRAERDAPWLKNNPRWTVLKQDAYAEFWLAYLGEQE